MTKLRQARFHPNLKLVGIYAFLSALWILFSDFLLGQVTNTPELQILIGTIKGMAFIAWSSLLLLFLLRRRGPVAKDAGPFKRARPRHLVIGLAVLSFIVAIIGAMIFDSLSASLRVLENQRLAAVAELKKHQIEDWLTERHHDLAIIRANPFLLAALTAVAKGRGLDAREGETLSDWLETIRSAYGYEGIEVWDSAGVSVAAAGTVPEEDRIESASSTFGYPTADGVMIDVHRHGNTKHSHFAFLAELTAPGAGSATDQALGRVLLVVDTAQRLYPVLKAWPGPSETGETLIFRRDGDEVLFLNPRRHGDPATLPARLPVASLDLPAAQALRRGPGVFEGKDYRGEPVLAVARTIAGTPWMLLAKIDQAEVFAAIHNLGVVVPSLTTIIVAALAGLILLAWRLQQSHDQLEAHRQFEVVAATAPGVLFTLVQHPDGAQAVPFVTPAVRELLGIAPEQLNDDVQALRALMPIEDVARLEEAVGQSARTLQPWRQEWRITHPARGERWIEGRAIPETRPEGGVLWHGFMYDVTDRHRAATIEREFEVTLRSVGDGVIATDAAGRVRFMNPVAETLTGWRLPEALGKPLDEVFVIVNETTRQPVANPASRVLRAGTVIGLANHTILIARDGVERAIADSGAPIRSDRQEIMGVVLVFRDQTEQRKADLELRKSTEFYRRTVTALSEGVVVFDREGRVLGCNPAAERILGLTEADMQAKPPGLIGWQPIYENGSPFPIPELPVARTLATGQSHRETLLGHINPDRSVIWLQVNTEPVLDVESGRLVSVVTSFTDVTSRKEAELARLESEGRLRAFIDNADQMVWITDTDGRLLITNPYAETILGRPAAEQVGCTVHDLWPADLAAQFARDGRAVLETNRPVWAEAAARVDGGERVFLAVQFPLRDATGKINGLGGICSDITARKRAEEQLQQREITLRHAQAMAHMGSWTADLAAGTVVVTPECAPLLGLVAGTHTVAAMYARSHPEDLPKLHAAWAAAREGTPLDLEYRIVLGQEVRWLHAKAETVTEAAGRPITIIGMTQDITERKRFAEDLQTSMERAEAANVAKSRFLASMSHELRTPLNAILGFSEILLKEEDDPVRQEYFDIVKQSARNLLRLIEDILDFSKIEAGRITVQSVPFDLRKELTTIAGLFRHDAESRNLGFGIAIEDGIPERLIGDPGILRQILLNLISNALKFTNQGEVRVSVAAVEGTGAADGSVRLVFHVTDTGIGIQRENQTRIFEMFEQEDNSSTKRFGGSGLGLAIVKRLVTLLGGDLWLESAESVGSRFSFALRYGRVSGAAKAPADPLRAAGDRIRRTVDVLLVEDDPFSRKLVRHILGDRGYQVTCADNGAEALALLENLRPDVILMDIQMPVMGGLEATRQIRAGTVPGADPAVPIIAVTAYAMAGDRERLIAEGLTDYVSKPIDHALLLEVVDRWLRRDPAFETPHHTTD